MIKKKGSKDGSNKSIKKIEGQCDVEWGSPKCSKDRIAKNKNLNTGHLTHETQNLRHTAISSPLQTACHLSPTIKFRYSSPTQSQGLRHSTPLRPRQKRAKCASKKKISNAFTGTCNEQGKTCEKDWDEDSFFDEPTLQATQKFVDNFLETGNRVEDNASSAEDSFFDEYTLQATQTFVDNFNERSENKANEINQKSLTNLSTRDCPKSEASEAKVAYEFTTNETTFCPNFSGMSNPIDSGSLNNTFEEAELVASLEMVENSLMTKVMK